jgi:tRNA(fMet)-specific endonuclease VapC
VSESTTEAGPLVLDTTAASASIRGIPAVVAIISAAPLILVPAVTLSELLYGALHAPQPDKQGHRVAAFEAASRIVYPDRATCTVYAEIKSELRSSGKMIPDNDIWIAAIAVQHGLDLLSNDNHFRNIVNLRLVSW